MTYTASLYPDTYLFLTRPDDRLLDEAKSPGFGYLDRLICFSHFRRLSIWKNSCVVVHKNCGGRFKFAVARDPGSMSRDRAGSEDAFATNYASPIVLDVSILVLVESAAVWRFCLAFSGWETRVMTFTSLQARGG